VHILGAKSSTDVVLPSLADQANNLPSAYCEIITNDQMVYKTRV
jgi:hypothetical protein